MENVLEVLLPKSVKLLRVGVLLPAKIGLPFPVKFNVAVGALVFVYPLATPPGLTQFEVAPVNAKFVSVPVTPVAASVNVVIAVFVPDGMP